jgi:hypothetical protein
VILPTDDRGWPALPLSQWRDTRDTLHLWTQMVGKTRLALSPRVNHWWHVPLYVNAVGLTTSLMPISAGRGLEIIFNHVDHSLVLRATDGRTALMRLEPRSVADFFTEYRARLDELDVEVVINPIPTEIVDAVPFHADHDHTVYDPGAAHDFWRSLVSAHRVLSRFRGEFTGKASPVHFFWGAFDLAVSRFSGRPAPTHPGGIPHCPDWVMIEAYNQEVSSCGYWPGGASEGIFYAYAYPEPEGFREASPGVEAASFDADLGEFVLPYADVRAAEDPDAVAADFLEHVHRAASVDWPGHDMSRATG